MRLELVVHSIVVTIRKMEIRMTGAVSAAAVVLSMMLFSAPAAAECACFCVGGDLQTVCTTVEEAQDAPAMCGAVAASQCPSEVNAPASTSYDAPEEGATNCRDIRIFDARRGVFKTVKACDVLGAD